MICLRSKCLLASALCFILAMIILVAFPFIYEKQVAAKTNFVESSFLFPIWRDLPLPIYQRMYFFNITNSEEFLQNGTTMRVKEVGPYTFVARFVKKDLKWYSEGTVSYREVKTYQFVTEESVGGEDDVIYTLNAPYVIASDVLSESGARVKKAANKIFNFIGERLLTRRTVRELTFDGYRDPIMRFGKYFRWDSPFRKGIFSWLYGRNATDDGVVDVYTGETDHNLLNVISRWNGDTTLDFWNGEHCNMINGTNGEFSPPLGVDQTEYTFFQPAFCRSVTFRYGGIETHEGIESRRFENDADIFSKQNPDNHCFEVDPELESGVLDISPCQYGAPVVLSFPHFYLADSSFLKNVHGLQPNKDIHGSHIDVEPVSGVTVDLSLKFQINLKVKPVEHLSAFQNATAGVYPVFWIDLDVQLPEELTDLMKCQLFMPSRIVNITVIVLMIASLFFLIVPVCKMEVLDIKEMIPLLERDSPGDVSSEGSHRELRPRFLTSTPDQSIEIFRSFKDMKKSGSHTSGFASLSPHNVYDSFSEDESSADSSVEVERTKLFKKRFFKEARVLTVI